MIATMLKTTKTSIRTLVCLSLLARPSLSLIANGNVWKKEGAFITRTTTTSFCGTARRNQMDSRRFLSSGGTPAVDISHIGKTQMEEILEEYEQQEQQQEITALSSSSYVVMDVRTEEEIYATGKLSDKVHTLPIQVILQANVFAMDAEEFEDFCGFAKPTPDETLVFSCAAGVRSVYACQAAAQAGYTKLVNYMGGSNEWFAPY